MCVFLFVVDVVLVLLLWIICFLCLVFLMLSRLFIAPWERADLVTLVGDVYNCILYPGSVWYLIVSFPDLCRLSYFLTRYD